MHRRIIASLSITIVSAAVLSAFALPLGAEETRAEETRAEETWDRARFWERVDRLASNAGGMDESARLTALLDAFYQYTVQETPELGTLLGHPTGHGRWSDRSAAALERRKAETVRSLTALRTIDRTRLDDGGGLDYDLAVGLLEERVEAQRFSDDLLPITQMGGVQQAPAQLLAMMPKRTAGQYEDVIARLAGLDTLVEQTIEALRRGLAKGITPPRVTLRDVPQQVLNVVPEDPMASSLLAAFAAWPDAIAATDRERLLQQAVEIYTQEVRPAYLKLHAFLSETYLPGARDTVAMRDLPDGEAWYAFNVRRTTTTELSPQEIHDLGLSEVARIRKAMQEVIAKTDFEGTFEAFLDFLRTDRRFFYERPEDLLRDYRDISKRADAALPRLFHHLPRLPYGVAPVPAYAEKSQTTAYYQPGSLELGRAGTFFANTYRLETRPKWEMEALTLHEAVPGHHLQIALGQELEGVSKLRRMSPYIAFAEGWGLYAESLGEEMGFYQDPYSKFGQLTYEMWRAVRLVVDTGIHALGWSRQQAIEYFLANTGKSEHDIRVEVDRYIVWPGQALAYKVGELKIRELRDRAERELGERFDVRDFHAAVLGAGALPLDVLEARINAWILEQQGPET